MGPVLVTVLRNDPPGVLGRIKVDVAGGQKAFLGIITKSNQATIGRINLFSLDNGEEGISSISVFECTCPEDLNHDCIVDSKDLTLLLGAWAAGSPAGDVDGDGDTDSDDLTFLLGEWADGGCV